MPYAESEYLTPANSVLRFEVSVFRTFETCLGYIEATVYSLVHTGFGFAPAPDCTGHVDNTNVRDLEHSLGFNSRVRQLLPQRHFVVALYNGK